MKTLHTPRLQQGASLLIALIFLVMMAMLGVTVANVTNLEERMAGNTRDRDLALQSAEAALREAERMLADPANHAGWPAVDPLKENDSQYWEACFEEEKAPCDKLQDLKTAMPSGTDPGAVALQPQFVIETKPDVGTTKVFRVTSRAVGGSQDTIVVLQAEFGHTPPP